jgi:hypothetical protein
MRTLEGTLDPKGTIRFREKVRLTRPQRVLVTLLEEESTLPENGDTGSLDRLLSLLASPEFRDRPVGSAEELEAVVEHNRNAWNESAGG